MMPVSARLMCRALIALAVGLGCSLSIAGASSSIALTPDHRTICAVNQDSGSVSVWEWSTEREPVEIPVGDEPRMLAVAADGRHAYVTTQRSQWLAIVDLTSKTCLARIPIGGQPVGVVIARGGRHAFVTQYAGDYSQGTYHSGMVAMVDLDRQVVEKRIVVKAGPFAMTCSPDGKRLYVTHYFQIDGQGWVSEIDVDEFRVVREFAFKPDPEIASGKGGVFNALAGIAVHPDGMRHDWYAESEGA